MQAVVNVVLPVFAIVLAGYACGRFRLLGPGGSEALNGFVYFAALPALFFGSLAKVELSQIFNWPYLSAYLLGLLASAVVALIVGRLVFRTRGAALAVQNMGAIFANTGYMGIPLAITAFGREAALPAILLTIVNGALVMGLYILWIEAQRSTASHRLHVARDALAGVFKSPLGAVGDRGHPVVRLLHRCSGADPHLLRHHGRGGAAGRLVRHGPVHGGQELQGRPDRGLGDVGA